VSILGKFATRSKFAARRILSLLTSPQATCLFGEPLFWLLGLRQRQREIDLSRVQRVLVVRLDEIGDVVMTTSFLRELRRNIPDAWITLVVNPVVHNLVELCPYVNEVLTYDGNIQGRFAIERRRLRALYLAMRHLWCRRFDLAIVPRWDADYYHASFVAYFSGASWRVGYSEKVIEYKKKKNCGYDNLFTHVMTNNTLKHEVERNLDVLRFLGRAVADDQLELSISKEDEEFAMKFLSNHNVEPHNLLVAISPGARELKRQWPIENYIGICLWLQNTYDASILVVGGSGEGRLGEILKNSLQFNNVINSVEKTTLRQTIALLKHCRLFVGNDSGPLHMAVAVGLPVVEISCHQMLGSMPHSNSPARFGPWRVPHSILQPDSSVYPCSDACTADQPHCICKVTVEQVKAAISGRLLRKKVSLNKG